MVNRRAGWTPTSIANVMMPRSRVRVPLSHQLQWREIRRLVSTARRLILEPSTDKKVGFDTLTMGQG